MYASTYLKLMALSFLFLYIVWLPPSGSHTIEERNSVYFRFQFCGRLAQERMLMRALI